LGCTSRYWYGFSHVTTNHCCGCTTSSPTISEVIGESGSYRFATVADATVEGDGFALDERAGGSRGKVAGEVEEWG